MARTTMVIHETCERDAITALIVVDLGRDWIELSITCLPAKYPNHRLIYAFACSLTAFV